MDRKGATDRQIGATHHNSNEVGNTAERTWPVIVRVVMGGTFRFNNGAMVNVAPM